MYKLLVVEDSPVPRQMILEMLKSKKLQVRSAEDGVEALEQVKLDPPDLIILDIVMPKMNGYEVCRKIKNDPATKDVLVLMCSSKKEEFDIYWGMKQGADDYITKPFKSKELLVKIKKLLLSRV
ncbi:MAG: response regulator [Prochloron sp. SP5CPC1]|nr:response regulator [Candidatus Paraprochloron terpiosi SP5CPC1]